MASNGWPRCRGKSAPPEPKSHIKLTTMRRQLQLPGQSSFLGVPRRQVESVESHRLLVPPAAPPMSDEVFAVFAADVLSRDNARMLIDLFEGPLMAAQVSKDERGFFVLGPHSQQDDSRDGDITLSRAVGTSSGTHLKTNIPARNTQLEIKIELETSPTSGTVRTGITLFN